MSYVPYHPDVWPPEPAEDLRPRLRALRWACAFMSYLLAIAVWVYWMKLPPKIEPPLATIHLPDATELRLVHFNVGMDSGVRGNDTFGNRIRLGDLHGRISNSRSLDGGVWMIFSRFHPQSETFHAPRFSVVEILEEGSPYPLQPSRIEVGNGPCTVLLFPAVPRKSPTLTIKVFHEGQPAAATIPNPVYQWTSKPLSPSPETIASPGVAPLPQQLDGHGFTARFEKVVLRETPGASASPIAQPSVRVTHPLARPADYVRTFEWFDSTGNRVNNGVLPWSEPVWGLRVRLRENATFPVPADRLISLGLVTTPGPGQAISLNVTPEMKAEGITDLLVIGAGTYNWAGKQLMNASAVSGKSSVAAATVATVAGWPRSGSLTEPAWGIYVLATSHGKRVNPESRAVFRIKKGDVICTHTSSGESKWSQFQQRHFGSYRHPKSGPIGAGEEIEVETFSPKTRVFEFQIPRPDFPKTPAK